MGVDDLLEHVLDAMLVVVGLGDKYVNQRTFTDSKY